MILRKIQVNIRRTNNKLGDSNAFSDIINNLKTLGNEESLNNLFKDFTDSFQNS